LNIIDPEKTLHDVFKRKAHVHEAIVEYEGMHVLPAPVFSKTKLNPLKLKDKIQILKKDYDILLIDSSPNLNEETLGVILSSDEIYVVTTADHATLSMTLKAVKLAKQRGTPIKGIIINKFHNKNFETPLGSIEEILDIPVMAVIPYDVGFLKALSEMKPFVKYKPKAEGSIEFKKLAAALTGEKHKKTRFRDFYRKMKPKKQDINRVIFYESVFEK
jgi:MinD-like ATPase involved in chromosome partitioning or flagellar assembly